MGNTWEDPEYNRINNEIDVCMRNQERIAKRNDVYIAKHGRESKELTEQYNKLCDIMDSLLKERHEISKRMMATA